MSLPKLTPEQGDSADITEMKGEFNRLMNALKWFKEHGLNVNIKSVKTGYKITISK